MRVCKEALFNSFLRTYGPQGTEDKNGEINGKEREQSPGNHEEDHLKEGGKVRTRHRQD